MKKTSLIAIVGPTASGKTEFSINLAKEVDGEIISADSRLVYKGFNKVCAKPTIQERCGIPHYMMDLIEPEIDYSAAIYAKEARKAIKDIISRGKKPIIVGGTGLYFRLLLENYDLPKVPPDYKLREELKKRTTEELIDILSNLDSLAINELESPNDRKKLIRTIEIVKNGGCPLAKMRGIKKEDEFETEWLGKNYPREELYKRINNRVDKMLENGMIEETKELLKNHGRIPNITETIGYREIISYLDGKLTLEEALEQLKQNTRRYAKRQLTWFRKNDKIKWDYYPETLKK